MTRIQVNIRVTQEQHDVLQAAVYVRELKSAQDLLAPEVEHLTAELMKDRRVAEAYRLRAVQRKNRSA
ncbi:MAG: hypothetical protein V9E83_09255 [Baekduia sp.]